MSEAVVRARIKTLMESVTGIGKVYDYQRHAAGDAAFISLFKDTVTNRILGWQITREKAPLEVLNLAEEERAHGYRIDGYMGVEDADGTEKLFNALIELVCDKFRLDFSLSLGDGYRTTAAVSIDSITPKVFGAVLCHTVELRMTVYEIFN